MNLWSSHDFLDCLGWTLLHFLWQGLIIASLAAVAFRLLRRHSANARYLAGCFALLLMAAARVATFCSLNRAEEIPTLKFTVQTFDTPDTTVETPRQTAALPRAAVVAAPKPAPRKTTVPELLEASLPWLVAAWSLGVLALSCRLFAGWLFIQKLRRSATLIDPLQARLKQLAARIGVSRPIRLLQSAWVEVPTVIGWLRPIILLPASCLIGLTPGQLESILAHELAHIRRHDYLVNLLQNVVETLLFYHPAVWWVSRRIRAEREHCCDDLAVKTCGDAAAYARALATLEELRPAPAPFALAAAGAPLLERIRRLAGQPERSAVRPAWPVAGVIALLLLALLAAALRNNPASAQPAAEPPHTNQIADATTQTNSTATIDPLATPPRITVFPVFTNTEGGVITNGAIIWQDNSAAKVTPFPLAARPTQTNQPPSTEEYNRSLGERRTLASREKNTQPKQPSVAPNQPLPQIDIQTRWVEVDTAKLGTNTIASLLNGSESQTPTAIPATFAFAEFYLVQPTNLAEPANPVFLHTNSYTVPLSFLLSDAATNAAIKKLEQFDGVDILTAPELTTESGRQSQVQAVDIQTILVGPPPTNMVSSAPPSKNLFPFPSGPVVDLVPRISSNGRDIDLTVVGAVSEFVGYENPAAFTNQNGKPYPYNWAIPHIRSRQFTVHVTVDNGQTLVLGSAATPITTVEKTRNKVPILGDIPLIKPLFRSTKTSTNTVQKTLLLLVTVKLVNPDGTLPAGSAQKATAAALVQDGKSLYLAGKLDQAEARMHQALQADPTCVAAPQYLLLIEQKRHPDPAAHLKSITSDKGLQKIISKLEDIRFDSVTYHDLPLGEVVKDLNRITKERDPEKIGVQFLISREADSELANVDTASIKITVDRKNARLGDVLAAITTSADTPIRCSILDYAVVFSLRNTNEAPRVADLVRDGKLLYEASKLDEAEAKLKLAYEADPDNAAAWQYLRLIEQKRIADSTRQSELRSGATTQPTPNDRDFGRTGTVPLRPNPFNRTNLVYTSKGRRAIMDKLNSLRVDNVAYDHVRLSEVINDLARRSEKVDPDKNGILFFYSRDGLGFPRALVPGTIDPATGLPVPVVSTAPPLDPDSVVINIHPALKNARLIDALAAVTKNANAPIKFSILDHAVVFSRRDTNEIPLEIRTFHVDPKTFREHLEGLGNLPRGAFAVTNMTNGFSYASSGHPDALQVSVRKFFDSVGVDFGTNNPANIGKAFVWGDKRGILTVRATASDLDLIAAAIENLNAQPLQINLKVKVVEVIQNDNGPIGFNWTLGNFNISSNAIGPGGGQPSFNVAPSTANPPLTSNGVLAGPSLLRNPLNAPTLGTISGILTDPQYQVALQALDQRGGVNILSTPEVTTISGRKTHIQATNLTNTPTAAWDTNPAPALDIVPTVSPDEHSLQLNVTAIVSEFLGYDNPGKFEPNGTKHPAVSSQTPLPHYRVRQVTSDVTIADGQTLVMGGFISQVPEKQAPARVAWNLKPNPPARRKNIMIFVTATLMNPDGTPYHSEEQRAALPAKPLPLLPAK